MTYQDPDPLRDPNLDRATMRRDRDYGSNAMWGWIAGAVVLVLILVFLFGGSSNTNTADMRSQPSASAPVINPPPANNVANAPRPATPPAETSGQGQSPQQ